MKKVRGNLVSMFENNELDVIIHGCNCGCNMGSGIAKEIRERFPKAYEADLKSSKFDPNKLGDYTYAEFDGRFIVNAYTQFNWGLNLPINGRHCSYDAISDVFKKIKSEFGGRSYRFGVPAIGAARAGGDWNIIKMIIDYHLYDEDVTFVEFDGVDKYDYMSNVQNKG